MRAALTSKSQADREVLPPLPADSEEMPGVGMEGHHLEGGDVSLIKAGSTASKFNESDGMVDRDVRQGEGRTGDEAVDTG